MSDGVIVRAPRGADRGAWAALRAALWPEADRDELAAEVATVDPARFQAWLALAGEEAIGFAEASLRHDHVNGTGTSPVAFLEGLYVVPAWRRRGVGAALVSAVEAWGRARGCTEFASDALLDNHASHAAHRAYGFEETERVVYFRKRL